MRPMDALAGVDDFYLIADVLIAVLTLMLAAVAECMPATRAALRALPRAEAEVVAE